MRSNTDQTTDLSTDQTRVTVAQAAQILGLSAEAVRMRIPELEPATEPRDGPETASEASAGESWKHLRERGGRGGKVVRQIVLLVGGL